MDVERLPREVVGWPDINIPRPSRRKQYVLAWSVFPASLREELERFLRRQSGQDLSEDGPPRPLRSSSLETREYQLRTAASLLVALGDNPASITSFSVLLSVENYRRILRGMLDRRGGKPSVQVAQLKSFLISVARHWLKVDDATLDRIKRIGAQLKSPQKGMTAKNRERLRPFNDDEVVQQLQRYLPVSVPPLNGQNFRLVVRLLKRRRRSRSRSCWSSRSGCVISSASMSNVT